MNKKTKKRKYYSTYKTICILLAVIALFVMTWLTWRCCRHTPKAPNPREFPPEAALKYMASEKFTSLTINEKRNFMRKLRDNGKMRHPHELDQNLTQLERHRLHRNMHAVRELEMKKQVETFYQLSKKERNRFLDNMIDEMKRHRKEGHGPRPGGSPTGNRLASSNGTATRGTSSGGRPLEHDDARHKQHMQAMLEQTDSNTRARMHEMMKAIHRRMAQRRRN